MYQNFTYMCVYFDLFIEVYIIKYLYRQKERKYNGKLQHNNVYVNIFRLIYVRNYCKIWIYTILTWKIDYILLEFSSKINILQKYWCFFYKIKTNDSIYIIYYKNKMKKLPFKDFNLKVKLLKFWLRFFNKIK